MTSTTTEELMAIYDRLLERFGPQGWWPAETPFEVMVGAVLTQNTAWRNVARAIANLKAAEAMEPSELTGKDVEWIARHIRPAGYYNMKARRLRNLLDYFDQACEGSMETMAARETGELRRGLLQVKGVGPETADSILLYALSRPVFVVDTYTYRVFTRHRLIGEDCGYEELREFFENHLPREVELYNEYHALIVRLGSNFCRSRPRCSGCPLEDMLEYEIE